MKFCPRCGKQLTLHTILGEGDKPCCHPDMNGCGFIDFGRFTLVVRGLLLDTDADDMRRVLLVLGDWGSPHGEVWHLPGGHVDCEETAEVAVVREVKEETGLDCEVMGLVGFRNRVDSDSNLSTAIFLLRKIGGNLQQARAEITQAAFFTLDQIKGLRNIIPFSQQLAVMALTEPLYVLRPTPALGPTGFMSATLFIGKT